jgi:hypothetical protein
MDGWLMREITARRGGTVESVSGIGCWVGVTAGGDRPFSLPIHRQLQALQRGFQAEFDTELSAISGCNGLGRCRN